MATDTGWSVVMVVLVMVVVVLVMVVVVFVMVVVFAMIDGVGLGVRGGGEGGVVVEVFFLFCVLHAALVLQPSQQREPKIKSKRLRADR